MPVVEINTSCNPVWVTIPDGAVETLAATYAAGAAAVDQTMLINAADGGPVIFQANAAATGSLVQAQTSTGTVLFNITDNGAITVAPTGALTLTAGAASTWSTTAGALVITSAAALTLTGAAASTWSTSAGALTLTSAAAATWSTTAGGLTLQGATLVSILWNGGAESLSLAANSATFLTTTVRPSADITSAHGDATHRWLESWSQAFKYTSADYILMASNRMVFRSNHTGATNDEAFRFGLDNALSAVGNVAMTIDTQSASSRGRLLIGLLSGQASIHCYGEELDASATCTAYKVVVWSGTKQVADAAATVNLTTIAGVCLVGAASGLVRIARHGRVMVDADAGITAGQLVGTSNAVAGNVQSGTAPGAGAIVGRACEATGGTVAGKVLVDLILG